jgi:PAS domain S-box-containing protein
VLTFNQAAEEITGHSAASALGRHVAETLQLPDAFLASLHETLAPGQSRRVDFAYRKVEGQAIDMSVTAGPLLTPVGRAGFLFNFQDTTSDAQAGARGADAEPARGRRRG